MSQDQSNSDFDKELVEAFEEGVRRSCNRLAWKDNEGAAIFPIGDDTYNMVTPTVKYGFKNGRNDTGPLFTLLSQAHKKVLTLPPLGERIGEGYRMLIHFCNNRNAPKFEWKNVKNTDIDAADLPTSEQVIYILKLMDSSEYRQCRFKLVPFSNELWNEWYRALHPIVSDFFDEAAKRNFILKSGVDLSNSFASWKKQIISCREQIPYRWENHEP